MDNTTDTITSNMYSEPKVISAELIDGRIEIVKRAEALYVYTTYPPQQPVPKIWKEIYTVNKAEIVLARVINAIYIPSQSESWEFEEGGEE